MTSLLSFASLPAYGTLTGVIAGGPTVVAVLAWGLIAALVGSGLGLLRSGTSRNSASVRQEPGQPDARIDADAVAAIHFELEQPHQEAA
jgi:hypothetical protein